MTIDLLFISLQGLESTVELKVIRVGHSPIKAICWKRIIGFEIDGNLMVLLGI